MRNWWAALLAASVMGVVCPRSEAQDVGSVSFESSCDASVQEPFNRAVALLHSFEYDDARAAFAAVETADPSCAIAAWGLAMTDYHPLWTAPTPAEFQRGSAAVFRTPPLQAKTEREQAYIGAIQAFYEGPAERAHAERVRAYEAAMSQLYATYPDDAEAGIFYALALDAAADPTDKTYAKQRQAVEILRKFAPSHPQHPGIAHYIIHNFDNPELAPEALPAAREYAEIAPASAHAQHMPSHIFTRLGLWDESIEANVRSTEAAREYAKAHGIAPAAWDEELHGLDYLAYAYLQIGMVAKAESVVTTLYQIEQVSPVNFKSAYAFAAVPGRYALERRKWREAAEIALHPADYPWASFRQYEAISIFARAYGNARAGRAAAARELVAELDQIEAALRGAGDAYWGDAVKVQSLLVSAWIEFLAPGQREQAIELAARAADLQDRTEKHPVTPGYVIPAREALAEMWLLQRQPARALIEYRIALLMAPNRLNGLLGAARSAWLSGERDVARSYYESVLQSCAHADPGHPAALEAELFLSTEHTRTEIEK